MSVLVFVVLQCFFIFFRSQYPYPSIVSQYSLSHKF